MLLFSIMKKYCIIFVLIYLDVPGLQCLLPDNINEINHLDVPSPYELLWTTTMAYSNVYHLTYKMLDGIGIPIKNQFHPNEEIASILIPKNAINYEAVDNDPPMQFLRFREASENIEDLVFESMSFQNGMNTDGRNTGLYLWSLIQKSMVDFKNRINYLTNKLNSKQKTNTKQEMMGMYNDIFDQTVNTVLRSAESYAETFNFLEKYDIKLNMNNMKTNEQNFNSHTFTQMKLAELYELYIKALTQFYNSKLIEKNWSPSDFIKWYDLNSSKSIIDFMASKLRTHVITLTEYINEVYKYHTSNLPKLTSDVQEYTSTNLKNIIDIIKSPLKKTIIFKGEETNTFELFSSFTYDDNLSIDTLFDSKNKNLDNDRVQYILSNWNDVNTKIVSNAIVDKYNGSLIDTDITHNTKLMEWVELMTIDEKKGNVLEASVYAIILIKNLENVISCMITKNDLNSDSEDMIKVLLNDVDEKLNALYKYSLNPFTPKGASIIPNIWDDIVNNKDNVFNILDWMKENDSNKNTPYWPNNENNDEMYLKNVLQWASVSSEMLFDVSLTSIHRAIKKDVIHSEEEQSKVLFILEDLEHSKHSYKEVTQQLKKYIIHNLSYINLNLENDSDLKEMALQELSKLVKYKIFVNTEIIMPSYKKADYYNLQKPNEEQIYIEHFKNMNNVFFQHFKGEPNNINRKRANGLIRAYKNQISSIYKKIMQENKQEDKDEEYSKTLKQSMKVVKKMYDIILNDLSKIAKANHEANLNDNYEETEKRLLMAVALITEDFIRYQEYLRRDDKQSYLFNNRYKYTTSAIDIAKINTNLDYEAINSLMNPENSQKSETNDSTSEIMIKVTQTTSSGTDKNQNDSNQKSEEQTGENMQTNSKETEIPPVKIGDNQDNDSSIITIKTQTTVSNPENDVDNNTSLIIQNKTISVQTNSISNENKSGENGMVPSLDGENKSSSSSDNEIPNETKITITNVDDQSSNNGNDDNSQTIIVTTTQTTDGSNEQNSGENNIVQVIISTNKPNTTSESNEEENGDNLIQTLGDSTENPNELSTTKEKTENEMTKNQTHQLISDEKTDDDILPKKVSITKTASVPGELTSPISESSVDHMNTQSDIESSLNMAILNSTHEEDIDTIKKQNVNMELISPNTRSPDDQMHQLPTDKSHIKSSLDVASLNRKPGEDVENINERSVPIKVNHGSDGSSDQNNDTSDQPTLSGHHKGPDSKPNTKDVPGNIYSGDKPGPSDSEESTGVEVRAAKVSITKKSSDIDEVTSPNLVSPDDQMNRLPIDKSHIKSPLDVAPVNAISGEDVENINARSVSMKVNQGSGGSSDQNDDDSVQPTLSGLHKSPDSKPNTKDVPGNIYSGDKAGPSDSEENTSVEVRAAKVSITKKSSDIDEVTSPNSVSPDDQMNRLPIDKSHIKSPLDVAPVNAISGEDVENLNARSVSMKVNQGSGGSSDQNDDDSVQPTLSGLHKSPDSKPNTKDVPGNIYSGDKPGPSDSEESTGVEVRAAKVSITKKSSDIDEVTSPNSVSPDDQMNRLPIDKSHIKSPLDVAPVNAISGEDVENINARSVSMKVNQGSGGSSDQNDDDSVQPTLSGLHKSPDSKPNTKDVPGNIYSGDKPGPSDSEESTGVEVRAAKVSITKKSSDIDEVTSPNSVSPDDQMNRLPIDKSHIKSPLDVAPVNAISGEDVENINARSVSMKVNQGSGGSSDQNDDDSVQPTLSGLHKSPDSKPNTKDVPGNIYSGDKPGPSDSEESTGVEVRAAKVSITKKSSDIDEVSSPNSVSPDDQMNRLPIDKSHIKSPLDVAPVNAISGEDVENINARSVSMKVNQGSGGSSDQNDDDSVPPTLSGLHKSLDSKPNTKDLPGNIYSGDKTGPSDSEESTGVEVRAAKVSITKKSSDIDEVTSPNSVSPDDQMNRLPIDKSHIKSPLDVAPVNAISGEDVENINARSVSMKVNQGSGGSSDQNDDDSVQPTLSGLHKSPDSKPNTKDVPGNIYSGDKAGPSDSEESTSVEVRAAKVSITKKSSDIDEVTSPNSVSPDDQMNRLPIDKSHIKSPLDVAPVIAISGEDVENLNARSVSMKVNQGSGGSSDQNDDDSVQPTLSGLHKSPDSKPNTKDVPGNIYSGDKPGPSDSEESTGVEVRAAKVSITKKSSDIDEVTSPNSVSPDDQMNRLPIDKSHIKSPLDVAPVNAISGEDVENINARSVSMKVNQGSGGSSDQNDDDSVQPTLSGLHKSPDSKPNTKDVPGNIYSGDKPGPSDSEESTGVEVRAAKVSITKKSSDIDEVTSPNSVSPDDQMNRLPIDKSHIKSPLDVAPVNAISGEDVENINARSVSMKVNQGSGGSSDQNDDDSVQPTLSGLHKSPDSKPNTKDVPGNIYSGDKPGPSDSEESTGVEVRAAKVSITKKSSDIDEVTSPNSVSPDDQMNRLPIDKSHIKSPLDVAPVNAISGEDVENINARGVSMKVNQGSGGSSDQNDDDSVQPTLSGLHKSPDSKPNTKDVPGNIYSGDKPGPSDSEESTGVEVRSAKVSITKKSSDIDEVTSPNSVSPDDQMNRLPIDKSHIKSPLDVAPVNAISGEDVENINARSVSMKVNQGSGGSSDQNDDDSIQPTLSGLHKSPDSKPNTKDVPGNIYSGDKAGPSDSEESTGVEVRAAKVSITKKSSDIDEVISPNSVSPDDQMNRLPIDKSHIKSPLDVAPVNAISGEDVENINARSVSMKVNQGSGGSSDQNDDDSVQPTLSGLHKSPYSKPNTKDVPGNIYSGDKAGPSDSEESSSVEVRAAKVSITKKSSDIDEVTSPNSVSPDDQMNRLPIDKSHIKSPLDVAPVNAISGEDVENINARSVSMKVNQGSGGSSDQNDDDSVQPTLSGLHKSPDSKPNTKDVPGNIYSGDKTGPSDSEESTSVEVRAAKVSITKKSSDIDEVTSPNSVSPDDQMNRLPIDKSHIKSPLDVAPVNVISGEDVENLNARSVSMKVNQGSGGSSDQNDDDSVQPTLSGLHKSPDSKPNTKDVPGKIYSGDKPGPSDSEESTGVEVRAAKVSITKKSSDIDEVTSPNSVSPDDQMNRLPIDKSHIKSPLDVTPVNAISGEDVENINARSVSMKVNQGSGGSSDQNDDDSVQPTLSGLHKSPDSKPNTKDVPGNIYSGDKAGPSDSEESTGVEVRAAKVSITKKSSDIDEVTSPNLVSPDEQMNRLPIDKSHIKSPLDVAPVNAISGEDVENINARSVSMKVNQGSGGSSDQNDDDSVQPTLSGLHKSPDSKPNTKDVPGNIYSGDKAGPSDSEESTGVEVRAAKVSITKKSSDIDEVTSPNSVSPDDQMNRLPIDKSHIKSPLDVAPVNAISGEDVENINARSVSMKVNQGSGGSSDQNDDDSVQPTLSGLHKSPDSKPNTKDVPGNIYSGDKTGPSDSEESTSVEVRAAKVSITKKSSDIDEVTSPNSVSPDDQMNRLPIDKSHIKSPLDVAPVNVISGEDVENLNARSVSMKVNQGSGGSSDQNDDDSVQPTLSGLHKSPDSKPNTKDVPGKIYSGDKPGPSDSEESTGVEVRAAKVSITKKSSDIDEVTSPNSVSPDDQMNRLPIDKSHIKSPLDVTPVNAISGEDVENINARSVSMKVNQGSGGSSDQNDDDSVQPTLSGLHKSPDSKPNTKDVPGNIYSGDKAGPSDSEESTGVEVRAAKVSITKKSSDIDEVTSPNLVSPDEQMNRLPIDKSHIKSPLDVAPVNAISGEDVENINARSVSMKVNQGSGGSSDQNDDDSVQPTLSGLHKSPDSKPNTKDVPGNIYSGDKAGPSDSEESTGVEVRAAKVSITKKSSDIDEVTSPNSVSPDDQMNRLPIDKSHIKSPLDVAPVNAISGDDVENINARSVTMKVNQGSGGSSDQNDDDSVQPTLSGHHKGSDSKPNTKDVPGNIYSGDKAGPSESEESTGVEVRAAKVSITKKSSDFEEVTSPKSVRPDDQMNQLPIDRSHIKSPLDVSPVNAISGEDVGNMDSRNLTMKTNNRSSGRSEQVVGEKNSSTGLPIKPFIQQNTRDINGNLISNMESDQNNADDNTVVQVQISTEAVNSQTTGSVEDAGGKNLSSIKLASSDSTSSEVVVKSTTVTTTQSISEVIQSSSQESDNDHNSISVQNVNDDSPLVISSDDNVSDNHTTEVVIKTTTVNTTQTTNIDVSDSSDESVSSPAITVISLSNNSSGNVVNSVSLNDGASQDGVNSEENLNVIVTSTTVTQTKTKTITTSSGE